MSELPITQINFRPGVIDLGMDNPDFDLLPAGTLQKSAGEFSRPAIHHACCSTFSKQEMAAFAYRLLASLTEDMALV